MASEFTRLAERAENATEADIRLTRLLDQLDRSERRLIQAGGLTVSEYTSQVIVEMKAIILAKQAYDAVRP